jgi:hypothetical protein
VEVWSHDGRLYEVNSYYSLSDNAWQYELVGLTGARGPHMAVVIPDATPDDGPFTPKPADHVVVSVGDGRTPWPVLRRLLDLVESSGDIAESRPSTRDELLSHNVWRHGGKRFEVNSFHFSDRDAWCYELFEAASDRQQDAYVEIEVPDTAPGNGPFVPASADHMTFTVHGEWKVPWPIFRRFVRAAEVRPAT